MLLLALPLVLSAVQNSAAQNREKASPYALIVGTVFRDNGFALRGAQVTIHPDTAGKKAKAKKRKAVSDARGEFTFRLPAAEARYNIEVRAVGFVPKEKAVTISGDERIDVTFMLEAAP
ncbi:MAG: carboxypeptidase regulatory-like domain-containing protein [Bryobacteraceae bacterium]